MVVLDDLAGAAGRVVDRLAVPRQGQPRRELGDALQRGDEVAERVRAAIRVEADGRRDPREEMVACDQHAVLQEADVPVGVAGKLEDAPAGDLVALAERVRARGRSGRTAGRRCPPRAARPSPPAGRPAGRTRRRAAAPSRRFPTPSRTGSGRSPPAAPARRSASTASAVPPTWSGWKCVTRIAVTGRSSCGEERRPALGQVRETEPGVDEHVAVLGRRRGSRGRARASSASDR